MAEQALRFFGELYEIEREVRALDTNHRLQLRQEKARPLADSPHAWMIAQRLRQIRLITLGRSNGLFVGSRRAGQRAAAVMSLTQSPSSTGSTRMRT